MARPSPFKGLLRSLRLIALLLPALAAAQDAQPLVGLPQASDYVAGIELHTAEELHQILVRAEQLLLDGVLTLDDPSTVTFILHGPEVRILMRENYLEHKATVDLAARLSALGVVEIKACRTWMGGNSVAESDLQPFVETVALGREEMSRLIEQEQYSYF